MRDRDVTSTAAFDAVVIGGGPAGASVGRLLASWGHRVLLLTKRIDPARGLAESLPPSTRKLLATVGVLEEMERAGFYRTTGNTVWWGSRERRVETFEPSGDASGFQVFRPDLDRLLRDSAARAGVQVYDDVTVRGVRVEAGAAAKGESATDELARVEYEQDGQRSSVACRFVLDCSGRAGVVARQGYRRYEPGGRMQAFIGVWQRDAGWDLPDETQTLVETYEDGWSWSVPISRSTRHVGAMLDATTTRITRGPTIGEAYRAELAKTRELQALMAQATLRHVWACDASLYAADAYAGPRFLLVGDAGSFIDPLSSFGVKKALASAWLAAIVVHTCLTHPDRQAVALDFFTRWERQVYASNLRRTRDFARRAHEQHPAAFWEARAMAMASTEAVAPHANAGAEAAGPDVDPGGVDEVDEEALLRTPEVQAAFELFKRSPSIDLAWADQLRFEKRAVIRGREIALEDAVPLPSARACLRFLAGVDLVKLGEMAAHHRQVADLYDAYCRTHAPVSLPGFLGGLSVLLANGALTSRSDRAR
jgi:flavin-dependent dehydrogenase